MRTDRCNAVSCNCGVAAREGKDVIVLDFCKGAIQNVRFASQGMPANGTELLRDSTGKNFIVRICLMIRLKTLKNFFLFTLMMSFRSQEI